jgi:hypothetical protein
MRFKLRLIRPLTKIDVPKGDDDVVTKGLTFFDMVRADQV